MHVSLYIKFCCHFFCSLSVALICDINLDFILLRFFLSLILWFISSRPFLLILWLSFLLKKKKKHLRYRKLQMKLHISSENAQISNILCESSKDQPFSWFLIQIFNIFEKLWKIRSTEIDLLAIVWLYGRTET